MSEHKNVLGLRDLLMAAGKKTEGNGYDVYKLGNVKGVFSLGYNYLFDEKGGYFCRWGKTPDEDPSCAPGLELLDLEISVDGCSGANCPFCYKSNKPDEGKHMSLDTLSAILDKLPPTLTQIALGITALDAHPDLIGVLRAIRERNLVPNFTMNGLFLDNVDLPKIVSLVGAIAVSCYAHLGKEVCYNAVKRLKELGLEQTNIHLLYHSSNLPFVYEVLNDAKNGVVDPNAVVLLGLKPKGRGSDMQPLPQKEFTELVAWCLENELPMGFDSCSASKFLRSVDDLGVDGPQREYFHSVSEPCESGLFSLYIDVNATAFPCSFTEGVEQPISLLDIDDFERDLWHSPALEAWREKLLANNRACPVYDID